MCLFSTVWKQPNASLAYGGIGFTVAFELFDFVPNSVSLKKRRMQAEGSVFGPDGPPQ
jgi:hypothetical protein